jgi:hypothetical protein
MSGLEEKLVATPDVPGRARATLAQLRSNAPFGLDELEPDAGGPTVIIRRSMRDTKWTAVTGSGEKRIFEKVSQND